MAIGYGYRGRYNASESFPEKEKFGLTSQSRRSAVSVPSNIAEGAGRNTKREFINFLRIAQGSLSELDTQLELAKRLDFINDSTWKTLDDKLIEEDKLLSGLLRSQEKVT
jgi:four helix bundle protein